MRSFIHRNLDPADRLGEILFALVMALGFTASVRLGLDEPDNRELFVGILGCNVAWAIVDGVMYVLIELFERERRARFLREVQAIRSDPEAIELLAEELDERLGVTTTPDDRREIQGWLLGVVRRARPAPAGIHRDDVLGGLAVALVIVLATMPVVVPFLLFTNPEVAVRVSNSVALVLLFWLGTSWARTVGGRPLRVGARLTAIGVVLVLITIALGG